MKVNFVFSDKPTEVTLTEAFAGASGKVSMGREGVHLWIPGDKIDKSKEIIFDFRNRPLTEEVVEQFKNATKGRFLTAHVALLQENKPDRIKEILKYMDYVLVPETKIKNTPEDFRNRVLSYIPKTSNE